MTKLLLKVKFLYLTFRGFYIFIMVFLVIIKLTKRKFGILVRIKYLN